MLDIKRIHPLPVVEPDAPPTATITSTPVAPKVIVAITEREPSQALIAHDHDEVDDA